jgi:hypothetical protein
MTRRLVGLVPTMGLYRDEERPTIVHINAAAEAYRRHFWRSLARAVQPIREMDGGECSLERGPRATDGALLPPWLRPGQTQAHGGCAKMYWAIPDRQIEATLARGQGKR